MTTGFDTLYAVIMIILVLKVIIVIARVYIGDAFKDCPSVYIEAPDAEAPPPFLNKPPPHPQYLISSTTQGRSFEILNIRRGFHPT